MKRSGKIILEGLLFHAHHGVHVHEQQTGNQFEVNILVNLQFSETAFCDELSGTIDYENLHTIAKEEIQNTKKKLMEPIAHTIAQRILDHTEKALSVTVSIAKLNPPLNGPCKKAKIEIHLYRSGTKK